MEVRVLSTAPASWIQLNKLDFPDFRRRGLSLATNIHYNGEYGHGSVPLPEEILLSAKSSATGEASRLNSAPSWASERSSTHSAPRTWMKPGLPIILTLRRWRPRLRWPGRGSENSIPARRSPPPRPSLSYAPAFRLSRLAMPLCVPTQLIASASIDSASSESGDFTERKR